MADIKTNTDLLLDYARHQLNLISCNASVKFD